MLGRRELLELETCLQIEPKEEKLRFEQTRSAQQESKQENRGFEFRKIIYPNLFCEDSYFSVVKKVPKISGRHPSSFSKKNYYSYFFTTSLKLSEV